MNDLDKAIAAAREANDARRAAYIAIMDACSSQSRNENDLENAQRDLELADSRCYYTQSALLAALDAARGEAVAWGKPETREEMLALVRNARAHLAFINKLLDEAFAEDDNAAPPAAAVPAEWVAAVQEFVDRVERGEIRSKRTYAKFKALLSQKPAERKGSHEQ